MKRTENKNKRKLCNVEQHPSGREDKDAVSSEVIWPVGVELCNEIKMKKKVGVLNPRQACQPTFRDTDDKTAKCR